MKRSPLKRNKPLAKSKSAAPDKTAKDTVGAKRQAKSKPKLLTFRQAAAKALTEWALLVKLHAGYKCEWCGKPAAHSHHMIARAQGNRFKFMVENGVALCAGCHLEFHNRNSLKGWELFRIQRPGSFEKVKNEPLTPLKITAPEMRAILADLREQVRAFREAA